MSSPAKRKRRKAAPVYQEANWRVHDARRNRVKAFAQPPSRNALAKLCKPIRRRRVTTDQSQQEPENV